MRFPAIAALLSAPLAFLVALPATALPEKLIGGRSVNYSAHFPDAIGASLISAMLTFAVVSYRYPGKTPTLGRARGAFLSLAVLFVFVLGSLAVSGKSIYIPMALFLSFLYLGVPVLIIGALFGTLVTRLAVRRRGT